MAFQAFFRRIKNGETPGFPRFKSYHRFPGWGYKAHGDGWRVLSDENGKHKFVQLSGVGKIRQGVRQERLGTLKRQKFCTKMGIGISRLP